MKLFEKRLNFLATLFRLGSFLRRSLIDPRDGSQIAERNAAVRAGDLETDRGFFAGHQLTCLTRIGVTLNSIETPCALRICGVGAT